MNWELQWERRATSRLSLGGPCPEGRTLRMFIVPGLGDGVKQYSGWVERLVQRASEALALLPRRCHLCGGEDLIRYGFYRRYAGRVLVRIQRMMCKTCGRTHAVLPSFLAPYRPYEMRVVERVFRLRLGGASWGQVAVLLPGVPLCVMQGWMRRARLLSPEVLKVLWQGIRHLSSAWGSEPTLRQVSGDGLAAMQESALVLMSVMKARHPEMELSAARLFQFINVYLSSRGAAVWV